jgi:hypothetical protein
MTNVLQSMICENRLNMLEAAQKVKSILFAVMLRMP